MSADSFKATAEQVVSQTAELTVSKGSAKAGRAASSEGRALHACPGHRPGDTYRAFAEKARGVLSDLRLLWEGTGGGRG